MYIFRKMNKRIFCLCLCIALLSDCGETVSQAQVVQDSTTVQTVQLPVYKTEIIYELPVSRVRVLVDRGGYLKDREKRVLFLGEEIAEEFGKVITISSEKPAPNKNIIKIIKGY